MASTWAFGEFELDPANPLAGQLRPGMSVIATILTDRAAPAH